MTNSPIQAIRWNDKTAIMDVVGDVDLHRSTMLQKGLLALLEEKPAAVIVNLAGVPYMDSSGVASLVKLLSRTKAAGVSLILVAMNPKVRCIFEITRLDTVFTIRETEQDALA